MPSNATDVPVGLPVEGVLSAPLNREKQGEIVGPEMAALQTDTQNLIRYALLSVSDKTKIVEFAKGLKELGYEILSTGGTANKLRQEGVQVIDVSEYTGFQEMMDGRVKTLHPKVHAGILARRTSQDDAALQAIGAGKIDVVVVNLYPFKQTIEKPGVTHQEAIENIDIGGPSMLRGAGKNNENVVVVVDPGDYESVLADLRTGQVTVETRRALAVNVFTHTSRYDLEIARYLSNGNVDGFIGTQEKDLKYGENPNLKAKLYRTEADHPLALHKFEHIGGTVESYINLTDLDRLRITMPQMAAAFEHEKERKYMAAVVKHGNACGAAIGSTPQEALQKMIDCDKVSILGGVAMFNFPLDEQMATFLRNYDSPEKPRLLDGVIAPSFVGDVENILERKQGKCRMLVNPVLASLSKEHLDKVRYRPVEGGFLRQEGEPFVLDMNDPRMERFGELTEEQQRDMLLAWAVGSTTVSNTITIVKNGMIIANAAGQQSRVRAAKLAKLIADELGHTMEGAVAYSDSFFPFDDAVKVLAAQGIKAIFASSGGLNKESIRKTAQELGVTLWQLPDAICRGFFHH